MILYVYTFMYFFINNKEVIKGNIISSLSVEDKCYACHVQYGSAFIGIRQIICQNTI